MKVSSREENGDLVVELRFDAHDQICLKHDLLDIVDWYSKGPSSEKIYSCRKRMINENKDKLLASPEMSKKTMAEVNAMLSDPIALCEAIYKMPGYKNRSHREV